MSEIDVEQQPFTYAELDSPVNHGRLDTTLAEVFQLMLGFDIQAHGDAHCLEAPAASAADDKTAIVGFAGAMRGTCEIRMDAAAALAIATAMLGGCEPTEEVDISMCDAVGELCNMVAGGWKNAVPSLESRCSLSPPTVISGHNYQVHQPSSGAVICRRYVFATHQLRLRILMEATAAV